MLKISSRSTYAMRALMVLAQKGNSKPEKLSHISEKANVPLPFLEQIFSKLKKVGLIQATRGPNGGVHLLKTPRDISLADIVTALEGPLPPVMCSMPDRKSNRCHHKNQCANEKICNELDGAITKTLSRFNIEFMCREADRFNQTTLTNLEGEHHEHK